jgi:hypothetical protein
MKILQAPEHAHDSCIVAVGGKLRVVDPPKRICHGFANGCICDPCERRAEDVRLARSVSSLPAVEHPAQPWHSRPARQAA